MNYMIIQPPGTDPKQPPDIVQMFTDEQLFALGNFMSMVVNEHGQEMTGEGRKAASTFVHLLQQWEVKTQ